jgi:hypothetical protein
VVPSGGGLSPDAAVWRKESLLRLGGLHEVEALGATHPLAPHARPRTSFETGPAPGDGQPKSSSALRRRAASKLSYCQNWQAFALSFNPSPVPLKWHNAKA